MNARFQDLILSCTDATQLEYAGQIQSLWSGYGEIARYRLFGDNSKQSTVVVKNVQLPHRVDHPRGWNTSRSHQRKVRSYEIERQFYQDFASLTDEACRVPACFASTDVGTEQLMVLEDLDAAGFHIRKQRLSESEWKSCLRWLAYFHARFWGEQPSGLWETGTYWHLATRPDEWAAMASGPLKDAATQIDRALSSAKYQTLVHGDAKVANFCFRDSGNEVAAVDFQYVGGGCGIKDVAYFLGSIWTESECQEHESQALTYYFDELQSALSHYQVSVDATDVESEWRSLFAIAWADFNRFLLGWMPDHQKLHRYSEEKTVEALRKIGA